MKIAILSNMFDIWKLSVKSKSLKELLLTKHIREFSLWEGLSMGRLDVDIFPLFDVL